MAHAQKPDFVFPRNGRVHLNRLGASVQSTAGSRGVRNSGSIAGYSVFWGRVRDYWLPTPLACFPFTSSPVCHRVPSHFIWTLLPNIGPCVTNRPNHKCQNNFRKYLSTESLWRCELDKCGSMVGSQTGSVGKIMNIRTGRTEIHYQLSDFELHNRGLPSCTMSKRNKNFSTAQYSTVKVAISSSIWPGNPY
jgi:hypothetical protein